MPETLSFDNSSSNPLGNAVELTVKYLIEACDKTNIDLGATVMKYKVRRMLVLECPTFPKTSECFCRTNKVNLKHV